MAEDRENNMKISVDKDRDILLEEVYSGVGLKTQDGEFMGICMRDSGFEFNYQGTWYEAKNGVVKKLGTKTIDKPIEPEIKEGDPEDNYIWGKDNA